MTGRKGLPRLKSSRPPVSDLKEFLDSKVDQFNRPGFIKHDPISIPHLFSKPEDIEIAGLFAAVLSWGQRVTIINKCKDLLNRMDRSPYDFVRNHKDRDLKKMEGYCHRTFNSTDLLYFIAFLKHYYRKKRSLEDLFVVQGAENIGNGIIEFHRQFFSLPDFPRRTQKHIATPERKSACKRINMFLRWMVRRDDRGVDFGIWRNISPSQLICPCDVHVGRVARKLKLIGKGPLNWKTAVSLTNELKKLDPNDPVKYDFALFGLGVEEKF